MKKVYIKPEQKVIKTEYSKILCASGEERRSYNSDNWDGDEDDEFL